MKIAAFLLCSISALAAIPTLAETPRPESLLPPGEVVADIMALASPPRAQELSQKLLEATARNPDWWREHVAKATPGEPLAYDSRLGLTEAEYREFLDLARKTTMTKIGEVRIRFVADDKGAYRLQASEMPDLSGITLALREDRVLTPFGALVSKKTIDNLDVASPTGPWSGTQWSLERAEGEGTSGVVAQFALGRLGRDGRGILYYSAKEVSGGKLVRRGDAILFFPLTPERRDRQPG